MLSGMKEWGRELDGLKGSGGAVGCSSL